MIGKYMEQLAQMSKVEYRRLLMGDWDVPLSAQEQWLETLAKTYWDRCDAGWDDRRARENILCHEPITYEELHKAIVAYGRKYRR